MSTFTFGTPAAAAPAAPAFGAAPVAKPAFGAPAPAPGGGLFGSTPAPAPGGSLFGSTPAPAPAGGSLFGSTPAAVPAGGSLFGAKSPAPAFGAPAPAPGGFFGAPAPAPGGGGLFGSTPAPAPGLFGSTTPAPASGGLFGSAPAPSAFGATAAVAPPANLAGYMSYSSLPQDQKNNIDTVYQAIMNHKRTVLAVSTMAPKLLDTTQQADMAGGGQEVPLAFTVQRLNGQVQQLENQLNTLHSSMMHTKQLYETSTTQAIRDAKWPTEFVATRVGVTLAVNNENKDRNANPAPTAPATTDNKKKTEEFNRRLKELLDREMTHADQIYRMPSPYLWQCVEEMETRSRTLEGQLLSLKQTLDISNQTSNEEFDVVGVVQLQEQTIWKVAADLTQVHAKVEELRQLYNLHERGINVLEEARQQDQQYQRQRDQQVRTLMVKTLPSTLPASTVGAPAAGGLFGGSSMTGSTSLFGKSPAPAGGGLFGSAPAPAGGSLFGTPAPAPGGSLFGTPAPAPGGSLFGAKSPAPAFGAPAAAAPAGSSLFGSAPAPAAGGGLFGAKPAAAPAFGAAAPAPGGNLFGAPAPAASGSNLFGAPAPAAPAFGAPATGGLFGSTTATPKSKSKRSGSRRR